MDKMNLSKEKKAKDVAVIKTDLKKNADKTAKAAKKAADKAAKKAQKAAQKTKDKVEQKISDKKGTISIRLKLTVAFMIPVVLFLIAGIIIYNVCSKTLVENSKSSIGSTVSTISSYVSTGGDQVELIASRISADAVTCCSSSPTDIMINNAKMSFANEASADKLVADITVIGEGYNTVTNRSIKKTDGFVPFNDSPAGQYVANSTSDSNWIGSHTELDEVTTFPSDSYCMAYVRVLYNKFNSKAGYLIVDIKNTYIEDILNNAELIDGSYIAVVLNDGTEVISGDKAITFADKEFYQTAASASEDAQMSVQIDGQEYLFVYSPIETVDGIVCALVPMAGIVSAAKSIQIYLVIALLICCIVAFVLGSIFAMDIGKAIKKVNVDLQETASGNLTGELHLNRKDEFSTLTANIRDMKGSMKTLIAKMSDVSGELLGSANTVDSNSKLLSEVTNDISAAVDYIDTGIERQSVDTANCLAQMEELASSIEVVQANATQINDIADATKDTIESGMQVVNALSERVYETTDITKVIIDEMDELSKEAENITGIITTIEDISEETNLLALNASIEAARAGEAGRGFAVVADSIRGFALRSNEAAGQIGDIIGKLQRRMKTAIETAQKAEGIVNNQEGSLKTTIEVFEDIRNHIAELAGNLDEITTSIEGIERAKEDTLAAVENISETSIQTGESATELTRIIDKQLASVEKLGGAVVLLQQNATDLDEAVSIFKV